MEDEKKQIKKTNETEEENIARGEDNTLLEEIPQLVKLSDVAKRIGISPRTLYRYSKEEGLIPYYQFLGQVMFKPEDVVKFLEKHYIDKRKNDENDETEELKSGKGRKKTATKREVEE